MSSKLTRTALKNLGPGEILWDAELKGFGARRQKDCVTFFLKCRFNGRQRWVTIGRMGNPWTLATARAEVLRRLTGIADNIDPRRNTQTNSLTVKEAIALFLAEHGPKLKPKTLADYKRLFDKDITPKLGKFSLAEDLSREAAKLHADLSKTPRKANLLLMVLSSFFAWTERAKLRPKGLNPCEGITKYRETKRERFLSTEELKAVGEALSKCEADGTEHPFALAAIRLLIFTGARVNEILSLKWSYVDKQRACLRLPDSKTGAKIIRLNKAAMSELQAIPRIDGNAHVIAGDRKGRHLDGLRKPWQRIRKLAGIEDVRLHDLRHSFASVAAEGGASLGVIGKLLGHTQVTTTGRYAHLTEATVDRANEVVGDHILGVLGQSKGAAKLQQTEPE